MTDVFVANTDTTATDAMHTLVRRKLTFHDRPHLREGRSLRSWDFAALDATAARTPAKIRAIAQLCFARGYYNGPAWDYSSTFAEPDAAGELHFGDGTYASSAAESTSLWLAARAELAAVAGAEVDLDFDTGTANATGIMALLFQRGDDTILVFRETAVDGDYANILAWIVKSVIDGGSALSQTQMMKRTWVNEAGLKWGFAQRARSLLPGAIASPMLRVLYTVLQFVGPWAGFEEKLVAAVDGQQVGGDGALVQLSLSDATKFGYWPVTKAVIDDVRARMPPNGRLMFVGLSQGGGRAQMARMYTQKVHNERWPVITMSAIGTYCFVRNLFGPGKDNFLADMDPDDDFENVFDYDHVLDPWGTLGPDIGESCPLGVAGLQQTPAYKYCSRIYGYEASILFVADQLFSDSDLAKAYAICRYFTHETDAVMKELWKPGALLENGEPSSGPGCKPADARMSPWQCPKPPVVAIPLDYVGDLLSFRFDFLTLSSCH